MEGNLVAVGGRAENRMEGRDHTARVLIPNPLKGSYSLNAGKQNRGKERDTFRSAKGQKGSDLPNLVQTGRADLLVKKELACGPTPF